MASFDIVSKIDLQEVDNAVQQARREIDSRYDLKGSKSSVEWERKELSLLAEDEYKINAVRDILQSKLHRRGVDIQAISFDKPSLVGNQLLRQKASLIQGIDKEISKKIMKAIRDSKLKVQSQIEGEKIRVTSKSIDTLRECMAMCKSNNFGIPIQFENMK